jgi:hypothetical protein
MKDKTDRARLFYYIFQRRPESRRRSGQAALGLAIRKSATSRGTSVCLSRLPSWYLSVGARDPTVSPLFPVGRDVNARYPVPAPWCIRKGPRRVGQDGIGPAPHARPTAILTQLLFARVLVVELCMLSADLPELRRSREWCQCHFQIGVEESDKRRCHLWLLSGVARSFPIVIDFSTFA